MLEDDEVLRWLVDHESVTFGELLAPGGDVRCVHAFRSLAESRMSFSRFMRSVQDVCGMEGLALDPEHVIDHVRALRARADRTEV